MGGREERGGGAMEIRKRGGRKGKGVGGARKEEGGDGGWERKSGVASQALESLCVLAKIIKLRSFIFFSGDWGVDRSDG